MKQARLTNNKIGFYFNSSLNFTFVQISIKLKLKTIFISFSNCSNLRKIKLLLWNIEIYCLLKIILLIFWSLIWKYLLLQIISLFNSKSYNLLKVCFFSLHFRAYFRLPLSAHGNRVFDSTFSVFSLSRWILFFLFSFVARPTFSSTK